MHWHIYWLGCPKDDIGAVVYDVETREALLALLHIAGWQTAYTRCTIQGCKAYPAAAP